MAKIATQSKVSPDGGLAGSCGYWGRQEDSRRGLRGLWEISEGAGGIHKQN